MTINLPATSVEILAGRHQAGKILENISAAFWLHGRDNETSLFLFKSVHDEFAELADALGYNVTRRDAVTLVVREIVAPLHHASADD